MYKVKRIITRSSKVNGKYYSTKEVYKIECELCEFDRNNLVDVVSELDELADISIGKFYDVMSHIDKGDHFIGNITIKTESFIPRYERKTITPDDSIYVRYILIDPDWDEDDYLS